ncbi:hypothetical protein N9112_00260 [bacterium]|nr:hypothetical protein [bacterium]
MNKPSMMSEFFGIQAIALALHPERDKNDVVRETCARMTLSGRYDKSDAANHVHAGTLHKTPYNVLKPGFEVFYKWLGMV